MAASGPASARHGLRSEGRADRCWENTPGSACWVRIRRGVLVFRKSLPTLVGRQRPGRKRSAYPVCVEPSGCRYRLDGHGMAQGRFGPGPRSDRSPGCTRWDRAGPSMPPHRHRRQGPEREKQQKFGELHSRLLLGAFTRGGDAAVSARAYCEARQGRVQIACPWGQLPSCRMHAGHRLRGAAAVSAAQLPDGSVCRVAWPLYWLLPGPHPDQRRCRGDSGRSARSEAQPQ